MARKRVARKRPGLPWDRVTGETISGMGSASSSGDRVVVEGRHGRCGPLGRLRRGLSYPHWRLTQERRSAGQWKREACSREGDIRCGTATAAPPRGLVTDALSDRERRGPWSFFVDPRAAGVVPKTVRDRRPGQRGFSAGHGVPSWRAVMACVMACGALAAPGPVGNVMPKRAAEVSRVNP